MKKTFKSQENSVTPGLRIDKNLWKQFKEKYPRQANKMFISFVTDMLHK